MDRDEPRFAQASKQMLETGDFVDIRYQQEARNKKPVGIYWLQAAAVELGQAAGVADPRHSIWLFRLPSLLGAITAVLGTYWTALALTTRPAALGSAVLLASTILLNVEARLAKTDAVLLATVVLAMGALARAYMRHRTPATERFGRAIPAVFWTALAVGILVKGPITPMVPAFAVAVLCIKDRSGRWLRDLRPLPGLLWTLLLVLPWFVLILLRTRGAFLADSLGHDMLGKVAGAQEAHGAPPGTYLAVFWGTAWPITPFVALAVPVLWRRRGDAAFTFLLAWTVPTWLLFEAIPTKLPHYVLPTFPALAILAAAALIGPSPESRRRGGLAATGLASVLLAVLPVSLVVVLLAGTGLLWSALPPLTLWGGLALALVALVLSVLASRRLTAGAVGSAVAVTTMMALLSYTFILGHLLKPAQSDRLALSAHLASAARQALGSTCTEGRMASAGNHEPSLVFLTATDLFLTDGAGAAGFLKEAECRVALVEHRLEPGFQAALGDEPNIRLTGRVVGTAINGAKPLDIGIYVRQRLAP